MWGTINPPLQVTCERITSSPSRKDGMSKQEEDRLRFSVVALLLEAGHRLKLPQETTATSVIIFHRFFLERSLVKYEKKKRDVIVMTCLFLAAKISETSRRLRDVINTIHFIRDSQECKDTSSERKQEGNGILKLDQEYWDLKERIVDTEQLILRILSFNVEVFHGYRLLLNYVRSLRCDAEVARLAWTLLNDSLYIVECLRLPLQSVICACIYLASCIRQRQRAMYQGAKEWDGNGTYVSLEQLCGKGDKAWWQVFDADAKEVEQCCQCLLRFYEDRGMHMSENGSGKGHIGTDSSSKNMEVVVLEPSENIHS